MLAKQILEHFEADPDAPMLGHLVGLEWRVISRKETIASAYRLCNFWRSRNLGEYDRVLIALENRPAWAVIAVAASLSGVVLVPAYVTHKASDIRDLIERTDARLVMISESLLAGRQSQFGIDSDQIVEIYDDIFASYPNPTNLNLPELTEDSLYALVATSGTQGQPKLVQLTHGNIVANVRSITTVIKEAGLSQNHRFLSFLPLAHAYEQTGGLHLPLSMGSVIYFCDRVDNVSSAMLNTKPTLMTAVPRLYDLLYHRIKGQIAQGSPITKWLFQRTLILGQKNSQSTLERIENYLLDQLIRKKVLNRFGGELRYFVSGGAPLNPTVGHFFESLNIGILQGYGQTEAGPVISVNRPGEERVETVGPPLPGVEVKLSGTGELMVRGKNVMTSYWNDPKATSETVRDGWLFTGDLATIDDDGHIRIVGRLKEIIVTSGGDNIAPAPLEQALTLYPEILQATVIGDGRPWLSVLIALDHERIPEDQSEPFLTAVITSLNRVNPKHSSIRRFIVVSEPATIENGLMTPTQKIKRVDLIREYETEINALY